VYGLKLTQAGGSISVQKIRFVAILGATMVMTLNTEVRVEKTATKASSSPVFLVFVFRQALDWKTFPGQRTRSANSNGENTYGK
jgi:hypothetical protein